MPRGRMTLQGTVIEKAAAFDAYIAYFGTYTLLQRFGGASIRLT